MYPGRLCLVIGAAFATASYAELQELNIAEPGLPDLPVDALTDSQQQYEPATFEQTFLPKQQRARRATLLRTGLVIALSIAVLAITSLILECFRALGSISKGSYEVSKGRVPRDGPEVSSISVGRLCASLWHASSQHDGAGRITSDSVSCACGFQCNSLRANTPALLRGVSQLVRLASRWKCRRLLRE